ncbi:chaperone NapD [Ruegeria sp.]|uniref:chaperone NapD n=1 Tax=Ruegeria sp. TaxID=1879320 RepID=UPI003C7BFA4A
MNICGCLVHVAPDKSETARAAMVGTNGVELHAEAEDGRFVVVVEDTAERLASETIMDLHQIPGVISLSLTYHHFEDIAEQAPRPDAPSQPSSRRPMQ